MKLKFLSLFFLFSFANSQIKITGTVIDNKSGSPIPLVNIYNSVSDKGEITDNKGRFSFTLDDKQKVGLYLVMLHTKIIIRFLIPLTITLLSD